MRLSGVNVQNFRSIKNCSVIFKEVTAVIGENNAGKTALLRALNSVFNWEYEAQYFLDNTHQYAPRTVTKIILSFEDVPEKEVYNGKKNGDMLQLTFSYSYGNTTRRKVLTCRTDSTDVVVDDSFITQLKEDIDYVYIPASRGSRDLTWDENSIFKRVLTGYSKRYSEKRDNVSRQVERVAEVLRRTVFSKLETEIGKASMLDDNEKYSLKYNETIDYTLFLDKVGLNLLNNGNDFPVTEYGSGIKSLSVIALHRVLAQLEHMNVVLGIEEPETNLHPHAQKKLIASIMNKRQNTEVQAIMATHSTVIIDELRHEDIILARRIPDSKRGFHTEFTQLEADFWDRYRLDEYKHNNFFRYRNSEFFFAKYVIIVESITDAQVINHLISEGIGEKRFFVSVLNLDGVKNIKYPYFLLKSLGIPFSMVVDHDVISTYENDKLEASRDLVTYLPSYKKTANIRNPVLKDLWSSEAEKNRLNEAAGQSYTKLFEFCGNKKLYVMQYCLEMDLVAHDSSRQEFCTVMGIPFNDSSFTALLKDRKDAIKAPDKIMAVVTSLAPAQYPYSFKKIRTAIIADINSAF